MTETHPAAQSLARIFPPQHVQHWEPTLALYFPIGAVYMAHLAPCCKLSLSGACRRRLGRSGTQSPLYCKHSSPSTPCNCEDLLVPSSDEQAKERSHFLCAVTVVPISLLCMQDALWQPSEWCCGLRSSSSTGSG